MKTLLEDYKRRLKTITEELNYLGAEGKDSDKHKRLSTKASCYRTFISELEQVIPHADLEMDSKWHALCARATLYPGKSLEEVIEILEKGQ